MFTYYDVLGVSPKANNFQIKRAYRRRIKITHPDVVHDDAALRKVKLLNRAYSVLRDEERRADYDASISSVGSYQCSTSAAKTNYRWLMLSLLWLVSAAIAWYIMQPSSWYLSSLVQD